jgi:hypothetical protein
MSKQREPEFTVTDRRRFNFEGEVTTERPAEIEPAAKTEPAASPSKAVPSEQTSSSATGMEAKVEEAKQAASEFPEPTPAERKAQEDAFRASAQQLDKQMEAALGGRAQDLQMTFERLVASMYMSTLLQLGLMREEKGPPPQVDLVGARQTIDTLSILAEKTKGNLTLQEDNLLQNCLYELRMAYVEVTNVITRPPQPGARGPGGPR